MHISHVHFGALGFRSIEAAWALIHVLFRKFRTGQLNILSGGFGGWFMILIHHMPKCNGMEWKVHAGTRFTQSNMWSIRGLNLDGEFRMSLHQFRDLFITLITPF